jgi:hypothetical protein
MIKEYTGCTPYAFADPIHRSLQYALSEVGINLSLEDCKGFTDFDRDKFEVHDPFIVIKTALDWCHRRHPFSDAARIYRKAMPTLIAEQIVSMKEAITFRRLMQIMGTDIVVSIEKDYWLRWVPLNSDVIFTDVRQVHELEFVRENNGLCIFVYRDVPSCDNDSHVTETGLTPIDGDIIIQNNGTLDDLRDAIQHKVLIHNE